MALGHDVAVDLVRERAGLDVGALRAQAHRAAEVGLRRCASGSCRRGPATRRSARSPDAASAASNSVLLASGEAGLVARVLDRRDLHAEADAEVRDAAARARTARRGSCPRRRACRSRRARGSRRSVPRLRDVRRRSASSESTYSILTRAWLWMPAWRSASLSDLYESDRSTYLPHIAIVTSCCGCSTSCDQLVPARQVRPAWCAAAASCRSARRAPARAACAAPCRSCRRPTPRSRRTRGTLVNSEILSRSSSGIGRSARQSRASGWMPISRSFCTVCWVGLVFSSPAAAIHGT